MRIETAETGYGVRAGALSALETVNAQRVSEGQPPLPGPRTNRVDPAMSVRPTVNHGRWVVECPSCHSAQLASREDRRFFCVSCNNAFFEGRFLRVEWPRAADDIETELLRRMDVRTRNWEWDETLDQLRDEHIVNDPDRALGRN